ncbi:MAG TPA: DNA-formamidopyrimidine glycosylase family protein [Dongiaceae bacterium]|nr:DNA-formamidopyrimidine glycosylase family protein [Dongiaceae bacterium]
MPEIPDLESYAEALRPRIVGARVENIRIKNPFFLRTVEPPLEAVLGRTVTDVRRFQKRILIELEGRMFLLIHLMIAGRLHWYPLGGTGTRRAGIATFSFTSGALVLTEAGTKRRASLFVVEGDQGLARMDRGGIEVDTSDLDAFSTALTRENHTLKRALPDPRLFSGIGNAYSDEILHRARLSPLLLTQKLTGEQIRTLYDAAREVLREWTSRLGRNAAVSFPTKVTAFREGMAVHGRYRQPCPVCGAPIQRIVYAENECNYCPKCQTQGRILADRALSRLLREDWPRSLDEFEDRFQKPKPS